MQLHGELVSVLKAFLLCVALAVIAAGCASRRPAPVADRAPPARAAAPIPPSAVKPPARAPETARADVYTVKPGDTLYSIALDHGLDYRELAAWNDLDNMGVIRVGQQLRLTPPRQTSTVTAAPLKVPGGKVESRPLGPPASAAASGVSPAQSGAPVPPKSMIAASPEPVKTQPKGVRLPYSDEALAQFAKQEPPASAAPVVPEKPAESKPQSARLPSDIDWAWPVAGKIMNSFNGSTSKGIDVAGKLGQPITASAAGRVIFSGTGIRGLGKFVVIKHSNDYISVYGNNSELLVKNDQTVSKGQKIAEMGNTDTDQVKLHFEIRRFGKPIDPLKLLPERAGGAG